MTNRRQFLAGLLASGLLPKPSWADAGSPAYLAAAVRPDGGYVLCGIDPALNILFQIPLPDRGHAAAAHPTKPEAVAFARRPGTFAIVLDCATGQRQTSLNAPVGRHFYGHGTYSRDGKWLFTTENDYEVGQGRIGLWDVANGYARAGDFSSGGIGPHDLKRLPGTDTLVVANGGIETHPDSGRTKLNIATMQPNLSYIENGSVVETASLPAELHKNSIRHLAVDSSGGVAFAMQWQGDGEAPLLVGMHRRGAEIMLANAAPEALRQMRGYIGSIAFAADDLTLVVTSPRGGVVQIYDAKTITLSAHQSLLDASGVAASRTGVLISSGAGVLQHLAKNDHRRVKTPGLSWDNHLVQI